MYDLCIVGAGLIGSSAAKYAAKAACDSDAASRVCLVGPDEPTKAEYENQSIFGCYYDEGRITRRLDRDAVWSRWAIESIGRYRDIESESQIEFFSETGFMVLANENDPRLDDYKDVARRAGIAFENLTSAAIQAKFPCLKVSSSTVGLYEPLSSGVINPRKLVAAQRKIAANHGCEILKDIVTEFSSIDVPCGGFRIVLESGNEVSTKKVLLVPGAFLMHHKLLTSEMLQRKLHVAFEPLFTARIPLQDSGLNAEYALRSNSLLDRMPSLIYLCKDRPHDLRSYILPPIKYADGRYYVKFGVDLGNRAKLETPEQITNWCRFGARTISALDKNRILEFARNLFRTGQRLAPDLYEKIVLSSNPDLGSS